jgi:uncharacterized membrane protein YfcA
MAPLPWIAAAGGVVGILFGVFGVGGSSFATPVLALLGVQGVVAVASPLPATIPTALAGAWAYLRRRECDCKVAWWSLAGGVPGTLAGALLSQVIGGRVLLIASGVVLAIVGIRVLRPVTDDQRRLGEARRRAGVVIAAAAAVGLFTGLLANGGGFLLVPLYLVVLGLGMRESAATSLVVIAALSVPTLVTHWALGHVDWPVAGAFAAGAIPGGRLGGRLAHRLGGDSVRKAFGALLVLFAIYFTAKQAIGP